MTETVAALAPSFIVNVTAVPVAPPAPGPLIVVVKSPEPEDGRAVARPGLLELITLVALPPEMLTTPLPPSCTQSELGATDSGTTGGVVPGVVVMATVTKLPAASVITTLPGLRQTLGLNIWTVNASPLLVTSGGEILIEPGKVVLARYGGTPPNANTLTNPVPQVAVVAPERLMLVGNAESRVFPPLALRMMKVISRYAPVATSVRRNWAYWVAALGVTRIRAVTPPAESAVVVTVGPVMPVLSRINANGPKMAVRRICLLAYRRPLDMGTKEIKESAPAQASLPVMVAPAGEQLAVVVIDSP